MIALSLCICCVMQLRSGTQFTRGNMCGALPCSEVPYALIWTDLAEQIMLKLTLHSPVNTHSSVLTLCLAAHATAAGQVPGPGGLGRRLPGCLPQDG